MTVTQKEIVDALREFATGIGVPNLEYWNPIFISYADEIEREGIAPPDGYAIVPIEPTAQMISAAEEAYMPFGDMHLALMLGNLAAKESL